MNLIFQPRSERARRWLRFLALVVTVCLSAPVTAGPYAEGEYIEIAGTVADSSGMPVPDVHVFFQASKKAFSVTRFGNTVRDQVELETRTDPHGQFTFSWRWVDYYNHYQILVVVPRRAASGDSFEILAQLEISKRIRKGSPVVVALTVPEGEFLDSLRDFLASVDTEDERNVYDEMGNPDRIQTIEYPDYDEISWWYFRAGRAYRFREGNLEQVVHFEPIAPFDS